MTMMMKGMVVVTFVKPSGGFTVVLYDHTD